MGARASSACWIGGLLHRRLHPRLLSPAYAPVPYKTTLTVLQVPLYMFNPTYTIMNYRDNAQRVQNVQLRIKSASSSSWVPLDRNLTGFEEQVSGIWRGACSQPSPCTLSP